ncbi:Activating molecule in BECN1-regulated autophagy protein 1, partial [Linum perenne]
FSTGKNVLRLLGQREICPRGKHVPKKGWGEANRWNANSPSELKTEPSRDPRRDLISWVEAESLRHLSAKYCSLMPPPRSTIAAAFSPDGKTLASTHGDHTVKIIDCQTGKCLKVLNGHRRTPWVVRFHPLRPEILASGSLDHEVRLWDANTAECIGFRDFSRPIASIAFHAEGQLLAVASGHKLYIWHYDKRGDATSPTVVLRTKRSLRAVHFHPHAAPFLLTAEVNDLDSSDSSMSRATSPGYLRYPPPAVFVANVQSSDRVNVAADLPLIHVQMEMTPHIETCPEIIPGSCPSINSGESNYLPTRVGTSGNVEDAMETDELPPMRTNQLEINAFTEGNTAAVGGNGQDSVRQQLTEFGQVSQFLPPRDPVWWEVPFLQGWLMGQSQAGLPSILPLNGAGQEQSIQLSGPSAAPHLSHSNMDPLRASLPMPSSANISGVSGRSGLRYHVSRSRFSGPESGEGAATMNTQNSIDAQPILNRIQSELATSAAAAAELPCTVKLRVWSHDRKNPCTLLNAERCRLIIPHAVLCSEMGAHFSPCGRYLAACVACTLPHIEGDPGLQTLVHHDAGAATSPTRHPISAHQVMYELRIYSLEEATFGSVLVSRAIRAAHCLTSIQFSPTSEHILLAYGRRHGSLLKSIVIDGETTSPIYTVLEVYRVSDMELVRVLPSAEDEVNVACFHPFAGGGLVYGTKEGRLRVLQYDSAHGSNCSGPNYFADENLAEEPSMYLV